MKLRQRFDDEPVKCPNTAACALIVKLLDRDHDARISAHDLLHSDLIPISEHSQIISLFKINGHVTILVPNTHRKNGLVTKHNIL